MEGGGSSESSEEGSATVGTELVPVMHGRSVGGKKSLSTRAPK